MLRRSRALTMRVTDFERPPVSNPLTLGDLTPAGREVHLNKAAVQRAVGQMIGRVQRLRQPARRFATQRC